MSLTDIIQGAVTLGAIGVVSVLGKELLTKYYIPFTEKAQREYDIEEKEMKDDYKISEDRK